VVDTLLDEVGLADVVAHPQTLFARGSEGVFGYLLGLADGVGDADDGKGTGGGRVDTIVALVDAGVEEDGVAGVVFVYLDLRARLRVRRIAVGDGVLADGGLRGEG